MKFLVKMMKDSLSYLPPIYALSTSTENQAMGFNDRIALKKFLSTIYVRTKL